MTTTNSVENIENVKANLCMVGIKIATGNIEKAKKFANEAIESAKNAQCSEIVKDIDTLLKLIDLNKLNESNQALDIINVKLRNILKDEKVFRCPNCGWKNRVGSNFCTNCRRYLRR